ncbi:hypothetical protein GCM10010504_13080 [Streptomyces griseus]|nr:hypothetical protein GCM10010504_13080 [Streptomyces griseus]
MLPLRTGSDVMDEPRPVKRCDGEKPAVTGVTAATLGVAVAPWANGPPHSIGAVDQPRTEISLMPPR